MTIKKIAISLVAFIWIVVFAVQILVWTTLRSHLFGQHAILEMFVNLLQDSIWLLTAVMLPWYIILLANKAARYSWIKAVVSLIFVLAFYYGITHLPVYFRYQFYLIIPFMALVVYHLIYFRKLRADVWIYMLSLLLVVVHYNSQLLPKQHEPAFRSRNLLTVMSYNIRVSEPTEKREIVLRTIKQEKPDLVFIQEINRHDRVLFHRQLSDLYPFQFYSERFETYNGGVILSRFPFKQATNIDLKTKYMRGHTNLNHAIIRLRGQNVHLLNCHLYPSGHEFLEFLLRRRNFPSFWSRAQLMYARRQAEADSLFAYIKKLQGPIILCGDFNDTPNSEVYNKFSANFQNAFAKRGWGIGGTFGQQTLMPSLPRFVRPLAFDFLRIDHIFVSDHFKIVGARVLPTAASDHKAQIAYISIKVGQ